MDHSLETNNTESDPRLQCRLIQSVEPTSDLAGDVRQGLLTAPRSLPPKYFYDDRGSRLFDAICDTPEYYPTRTETQLLRRYAEAIVSWSRPAHIVEFGSGTSRKTRHLLAACSDLGLSPVYWPFDICESMVRESGEALIAEYPWLEVQGLIGDYLGDLHRVPALDGGCLYVFLGGTIGNFSADEAGAFLRAIRKCMRPEDSLLLGADRVKDPQVLQAAYNDASGVTADFNLNLLQVLNRELDADFAPEQFMHRACYHREKQQVEMYLVSLEAQRVRFESLDCEIALRAGEEILTEISRKFTSDDLVRLLQGAGLCLERQFQPDNRYFSLLLARPAES